MEHTTTELWVPSARASSPSALAAGSARAAGPVGTTVFGGEGGGAGAADFGREGAVDACAGAGVRAAAVAKAGIAVTRAVSGRGTMGARRLGTGRDQTSMGSVTGVSRGAGAWNAKYGGAGTRPEEVS